MRYACTSSNNPERTGTHCVLCNNLYRHPIQLLGATSFYKIQKVICLTEGIDNVFIRVLRFDVTRTHQEMRQRT